MAVDRNIGAGLLGNLPDPINFVPIPLVRGLTFAQKATRGALVSMGLVGATEPIRRKLDPTATNQETIGYIASAGIFGGNWKYIWGGISILVILVIFSNMISKKRNAN